ncbi:poly-gamma-glutamate synthesis protein (capsule biosynthesis protein) [Tessaracoccus bendigoensis DSM 12906]|uniref:Poly-gamma-glutamate synthesis protein (Capsule biosynthesis protein) n=1 Tax=Tessaracoccus bendigoensis DSM 12906 TaxID=1123357 RepID=A0A1M6NTI1_9ACTN|nr:CapA family protein [Tessaracoccus bendigoensis]SHJ99029.1 poly-gamma-glutamate synthesis protein (capsule biosynthesis protein) [Tessaracoccus bendigoensis DSM 12906]
MGILLRVVAMSAVVALSACSPNVAGAGPGDGQESPATQSTPPVAIVSASPTPSPTPFVARTATINVSGDLLWHNSLWKSAQLDGDGGMDFAPQLAALSEFVSAADLGICHSEVPFAEAGGPYSNYPMFAVPQEIAPAIAATGWDLCTTASNHTMDAGWDGLVRTLEVHHAHGILTSGSYATESDAAAPVIFTTDEGVKIAVISQTFGLNGIPKSKGRDWSVDLIDAEKAIADAAKARAAGADIVAVHMHAGEEYSSSLNQQQLDFASAVTASPDVDFVFGQHAHVVQPIDMVNGKWVFYGMGNLIAASGPAKPRTYDGYMGQVTFTETPDGSFAATAAEFAPTMITPMRGGTPSRVHLVADELRAGSSIASQLEESAARTRKTVTALGVEGLTERQ